MFTFIILTLIWAGASLLYSLINSNPWLWFLWVPLGFITMLIIFIALIYLVMLPIFAKTKPNLQIKAYIVSDILQLVIFLFGIRIKVEGKENLTDSKRVLYVSNHKSQIDPLMMYAVIRRPMTAAGKSELWSFKPLMPLIKAFRAIKIDRSSDREAARSIIEGVKLMKEDYSCIIYPEGGILTREVEQMVAIKPGAYKLATKANAVIQPMAIIGSSKLVNRKWYHPVSKIIIRYLPAITPEDYAGLTTRQIALNVVDLVNKEFPNEAKYEISEEN